MIVFVFMSKQTARLVKKFCDVVALDSESTSAEYGWRLASLDSFLRKRYNIPIDSFFESSNKFDVYDVMSNYHTYLKQAGLHKSTIAGRIATAKTFLEYNDIPISNTIFKLKVRPPKRQKPDKQALSKADVRNIILACKDTRLQTYVLLLASTGMRATEALSIRFKDIDWENRSVMLRAAYTKTKRQRFVFLSRECIKHLKLWKEYRERERTIVNKNEKGKYIKSYVTRKFEPNDLFFGTGRHDDVHDPNHLYHSLVPEFRAVTDSNGFADRYENLGNRHKISFHSFRSYVKSTISDLGHGDYAEYYIGHEGSTYYSKTEADKLNIYKKIEPYLTYLDYSGLDAKGADVETKLEQKDKELQDVRSQLAELSKKLYEAGILKKD
jgi:integrase